MMTLLKYQYVLWTVFLLFMTYSCNESESGIINNSQLNLDDEELIPNNSGIPVSFDKYPIDSVKLTQQMIAGGWKRVESSFYASLPAADAIYEAVPVSGHIYFDSSKVYYLTYPCRIHCQADYTLSHNYITYHNYTVYADSVGSFEDGESKIYFVDGLSYLYVSGEYYVRDSLAPSNLAILKESIINPACLNQRWALIREEWHDYGTYDTLIYPWVLAEELEINKEWDGNSILGDTIYLPIDGKDQPFTIELISLYSEALHLRPGDWYEAPDSYRPLLLKYWLADP